jgi:hypothetical protein
VCAADGNGRRGGQLAHTQLQEAYGPYVTGPERVVLHALVDDTTEPGSGHDQRP